MSKVTLAFVLICSLSLSHAGIFNFNFGFRNDMDIFIRESNSTRCQWYNSGFLGLIPRRVNSTTFCHCRAIGKYECTTFSSRSARPSRIILNNSTTTTAAPAVSGNKTISANTTATTTIVV